MATACRWPPESWRTGSRSWARDVDVERVQDLVRGFAHRATVDAGRKPSTRSGLAAEEDVRADVEVVGQRQVLVDRLDPDARAPGAGR